MSEEEEWRLWLHARDVFLGTNFQQQNVSRGLTLARQSKHPDACLLVSLFPNGADTAAKARVVLARPNAPSMVTLGCLVSTDRHDDSQMAEAAKQGCWLAQAHLAWKDDVCPDARNPEPVALLKRADKLWNDRKQEALLCYKAAAEAGLVNAM